jgi:hypothetical protein
MKEENPLGSPFIWEPRCGRGPTHVAKSSPVCPQGVAVELKVMIVEGKEGKKEGEGGRP